MSRVLRAVHIPLEKEFKVNAMRVLLILPFLLWLHGCEQGTSAPEVRIPERFPSTPEILITNYIRAYGALSIDEYDSLLHPDYRTILSQDTIAAWELSVRPIQGKEFNREEAIQIHANICSGEPGFQFEGLRVPPVNSFQFFGFEYYEEWKPIPESDPFLGGTEGQRSYVYFGMNCNLEERQSFYSGGSFYFYAVQSQTEYGLGWYLIGIAQPQSAGKAISSEQETFENIKAMFRDSIDI